MKRKELVIWTEDGHLTGRVFDSSGAVDEFLGGWSEPATEPIWNLVVGERWYTSKNPKGGLYQPSDGPDYLFTVSPEMMPPEVRALALLLL
jgi:hypothetical protein